MARRTMTAIRNLRSWDGAARPMSESEALRVATETARDIRDAGFSITFIVENPAETDADLRRTLH